MPNIDTTDRLILDELQADARRSNKALAHAAGVSPSTMLARVRSLEQRGVVLGYHAAVDPAAIGRPVQALVSVRLRPKTPDAVARFVDAVWARPETVAVTMVTGPFDVLVHLSVPDVASLSEAVLSHIASDPAVVDEQTSLIFDHRRKTAIEPLP
ncbi:MAG: Lrp/AsnC family transcriptional regulator [Actinomycetota bacterium]